MKASRDALSNLVADTIYIETFDKDTILSSVDNKIASRVLALWEEMTHPTIISFENRRNKFIIDTFEEKIIKKNTESLSVKIKNESQKVKDIVEYTQFVINQRDLRKDPIAKIQTVMYDITSEIFKRIKLPEESFLNFIADEIIEINVDDQKSVLKELEMRKSGVVVLIRPDSSYEILHMKFEEAVEKINDIVHGVKHDDKKRTERKLRF